MQNNKTLKGIRRDLYGSYGSIHAGCDGVGGSGSGGGGASPTCPATIITIETDESTPLLVDQRRRVASQYTNGRAEPNGSNNNSNSNSTITITSASASADGNSNYKGSIGTNISANSSPAARKLYMSEGKGAQFCEFRLVAFACILLGGFVIATYLLVTEYRLPLVRFSLDLVSYDIWTNEAKPLGGLLNHTNVINVVLMHTSGRQCADPESCVFVLREMQATTANRMEIPYNFLIGGDGLTYEVRGWDHESGLGRLPQNTTLVVGFMGNYTRAAPSRSQLQSAWSLIRESVRRKKLQREYKLYGVQNATASADDGLEMFKYITNWALFEALLYTS